MNLFKYSIISFVLSLLSFFVLDWKTSSAWLILSVIVFVVAEKRRMAASKERSIRRGDYVDTDKIIWCKTCKHFLKIKSFESMIASDDILKKKLPCKIHDQTVETWEKYFQMPTGQRTMYPKECKLWEKK